MELGRIHLVEIQTQKIILETLTKKAAARCDGCLFYQKMSPMDKQYRIALTSLLGAAVFAFWMWLYPQAPHYQEQNQLFLFTWDYLGRRLVLPGGLADYISEFLVQLFYIRWAGALVMAALAVLLQVATWRASGEKRSLYAVSFIPSLLLLIYMGDMDVLVSYPVAIIMATMLCPLFVKAGWHRLWLFPVGWWMVGPVIMIPALLSVIKGRKWEDILALVWLFVVAYAQYRLLAAQYPLRDAFFGLNYYRLVEILPAMQVVIPVVTLLCILICGSGMDFRHPALVNGAVAAVLFAGTWFAVPLTFNKDAQETLAYDWLIRNQRYAEVIKRAEKYQPHNPVSACSVNMCLFMEGQLTNRFAEFYQCGIQGLVQPSVRDNLSDCTSQEILWMMGMPNITLQYAFDLQESIQNGRKSGRFTARIADCNIVNGWYDRASRYLDILSHSMFYRKWALERKAMIQNEALVSKDPVYAYIRSVRFKDDFITRYEGLDLMMAILYNQNKNNFMAAEYYSVWQQLKKMEGAE